MSMPTTNFAAWEQSAKAAQEAAKNNYIKSSQGILDTLNQTRDAAINNLDVNNNIAINQLNKNKETISNTALENAKQANINRLLSLKDNQKALNRAGLGTQGLVGSQVNSINTNYNTNLNNISKQKATDLSNVDLEISNTNKQNEAQKNSLVAQYAAQLAQQQQAINQKAEELGANAYANSFNNSFQAWEAAFKQWQAELDEQYRQNQLALQRSQLSNYDINSLLNSLTDSSGGSGYFSNGYQPDNIDGVKLKKSGNTITVKRKDGSIVQQNIWQTGSGSKSKYYYWDGAAKKYKQISKKQTGPYYVAL